MLLPKHALTADRWAVLGGVVTLALLAWAYLGYLAWSMKPTGAMTQALALPSLHPWGLVDFAFMFVMWAVMMVAMMLPLALPMILLFETVHVRRLPSGRAFVSTSFFVAGYLLVWSLFSLLATILNWALHTADLMSSMMGAVTPVVGGVLLAAAGIFQWTSLKHACLTHCRSPIAFLTAHWREGRLGALWMGLDHGLYCLGWIEQHPFCNLLTLSMLHYSPNTR